MLMNAPGGTLPYFAPEETSNLIALPAVTFVRVAGYSDPPFFSEPQATVGDGDTVFSNVVPVSPIAVSDDNPPAARRRHGETQGPGHTCFTRSYLTFQLSFGITHLKSQGSTCILIVLDVAEIVMFVIDIFQEGKQ